MEPVRTLELILALLGAALVLSAAATRLRLPPAAALVLGGMALAVTPGLPTIQPDPELILVLFLPPLLLSAGYFTVWSEFRKSFRPILLLSVGAVAFTTAVVGVVAHLTVPTLPWAMCFALGAIVSPPDAVAAKAVLQRLSVPKRLVTILEGESLVNDASGLVLYRFAVAAALTGLFNPVVAAASFVWLAVAGVATGIAVAFASLALFRRFADVHFTVLSSFLAAYAAYLAAEAMHASGVLAVVTAGIIVGRRQHEVLSAVTRTEIGAVWSSVTFVLEALVFVFIGLFLRSLVGEGAGAAVAQAAPFAAAVVAATLLARFVWVYLAMYAPLLIGSAYGRRVAAPPFSVPLAISWAGMRGVVSLAIALALPLNLPGRDLIIVATFGVIVVTVLVQGTTLEWLLRSIGLGTSVVSEEERAGAVSVRARALQASLDYLQAIRGPEGEALHPQLIEDYTRRSRAVGRFMEAQDADHQRRHDHFSTAIDAIGAGRQELIRLYRAGSVTDETMEAIEAEMDLEEMRFSRLSRL